MHVIIRLDDISNYQTIIEDLKPMLKRGIDCFVEKRPVFIINNLFTNFTEYYIIYLVMFMI